MFILDIFVLLQLALILLFMFHVHLFHLYHIYNCSLFNNGKCGVYVVFSVMSGEIVLLN